MRGRTIARLLTLPLLVAGTVATGSATGGATAGATTTAACGFGEICIYSGANQTGTMATVPTRTSCRTVASFGLPSARSAVDNHEFMVLRLYSDTACKVPATPAFIFTGGGTADDITPAAQSVNLLPIPAG